MHFIPLPPPDINTEPSALLGNLVFYSNLAVQEATGHNSLGMSLERLAHSMQGSPTFDQWVFAAFPGASRSDHDPEEEPLAFLLLGLPLAEDRSVLDVEVVLDPELQPLPGQEYSPEAESVLAELFAEAARQAKALGRNTLRTWALHNAAETPGSGHFAAQLRAAGFQIAETDLQGEIPLAQPRTPTLELPLRCEQHRQYLFPKACEAEIAALFSAASKELPHGQLVSQPQQWNLVRLHEVAGHIASTQRQVLSTLLYSRDELIGYSELTRFPGSDPSVLTQGLTYLDPAFRTQGLGVALKQLLFAQALEDFPGACRALTSVSSANTAMLRCNDRLGWSIVSGGSGWQKTLS